MKPGLLAVRAVNEYRPRDLISYVSLRHLFLSSVPQQDRWCREIAPDLTRTRSSQPYRHCRVYKGIQGGVAHEHDTGRIEYRDLHYPGPTEMMAEAALIDACATHGGAFARSPSVYSYILSEGDSRVGMADTYFRWWRRRQVDIRKAAARLSDGIVVYYDIKRFYPSISTSATRSAWNAAVDQSGISREWRELGARILDDYARVTGYDSGLLMGPMFAHILGNQILRSFDGEMVSIAKDRYFRYVDDLAFVVPRDKRGSISDSIRASLPDGLQLNDDKTSDMLAVDWVRNSDAFPHASGVERWGRLVGALKYYLLAYPKSSLELAHIMKSEGFRLPIRSYASAVEERGHLLKLLSRLKAKWFDNEMRVSSPAELLQLALAAREEISRRFDDAIATPLADDAMTRRFQIQRLRYTFGRLLYLASPDRFAELYGAVSSIRELSDLAAIMRTLKTEDVTGLLPYSGAVAQGAAQILLAHGRPLDCSAEAWMGELEYAWAVLQLSGVPFKPSATRPPSESPLVMYATSGRHMTTDPYYRELFSLSRNVAFPPSALIAQPFDKDEETPFDALQLLHTSS